MLTDKDITRFWSKVNKTPTCWLWTGTVPSAGYGQFGVGHDKKLSAHRVSWELVNGPIPVGLCVLHKCDVRICVNPSHLFLGTRADNARDRDAKGRSIIGKRYLGSTHPNAKLAESDVKVIRKLYATEDVTQETLGKEYGVSQAVISGIVLGKSWRHCDL